VSEEVRPFEEYKEMIKDMRKEEMIKGLYDLSKNIIEKGKEIERLNNIIKEIREMLYKRDKDDYDIYTANVLCDIQSDFEEILRGEY